MPVSDTPDQKNVAEEESETNPGDVSNVTDDGLNESTASNQGGDHDPYYPPIITLPEVIVDSGEEDEDIMLCLRAKLFRFDSSVEPPEWKERGTGQVKLLKQKKNGNIRVLMRRDKTLKICANHLVQPWMQLRPNCGSERAFVWSVQAEFADGEPKPELLAIKFANAEYAKKFKAKFEDAVKLVTRLEAAKITKDEVDDISKKVDKVDLEGEK